MNYLNVVIKHITDTLDPRIDKLLGFDVPAKWVGAVTATVVFYFYCWLVH